MHTPPASLLVTGLAEAGTRQPIPSGPHTTSHPPHRHPTRRKFRGTPLSQPPLDQAAYTQGCRAHGRPLSHMHDPSSVAPHRVDVRCDQAQCAALFTQAMHRHVASLPRARLPRPPIATCDPRCARTHTAHSTHAAHTYRGTCTRSPPPLVQVVEGKLTCVVAASTNIKLAKEVQQLFAQPSMRITLSRDVQGVEVCGALKNVLAIAAGIVEGKQLGSNALAAVVRPAHLLPQ